MEDSLKVPSSQDRHNFVKWEMRLIGDYSPDEVVSSLQKGIRRNQQYESCFWAYIFHQSGYGQYLWRRLSIICCEDVGNGEPMAPVVIDSLANSWDRLHKHDKRPTNDKFLFVVQAILFLCRAKKVRENDSLVNLIEEHWTAGKRLEIPPEALDSHTDRGRKVFGRFGDKTDGKEELRVRQWFDFWSLITDKAYKDRWEEELKRIWGYKPSRKKGAFAS